jgi:hypothetical protein
MWLLRAPGVVPRGVDHVERAAHGGLVAVERPGSIDAVRPPCGAGDGLRPQRARDQRRSAGLSGRRPHGIRARKRRLARPDAAHRGHLLVHALPAPSERRTDGLVVVLATADPDADGEPARAEPIHRRHLLRHLDGVVSGQDHDGGPKSNPLGQRRSGRELHDHRVARIGDALGDREACPRPIVDRSAPGEHFVAPVGHHRRQRHRQIHPAILARDRDA